jgi:hypothetical protein
VIWGEEGSKGSSGLVWWIVGELMMKWGCCDGKEVQGWLCSDNVELD